MDLTLSQEIGNNGFEWLWRLASEPRKLWRRDLIDGPRFLTYAFLQSMRARRAAGPANHLPMQPTQTAISRPSIQPRTAPSAYPAPGRIFNLRPQK